ncbi:MAG TPA: hypothetical protein ENG83_15335 [Nitrospirae bacterium]|nr:hypothetical protein [Nitrospirota bacterium]HDZ01018.1 hypothetical protein [Nitrospirota bacterium]
MTKTAYMLKLGNGSGRLIKSTPDTISWVEKFAATLPENIWRRIFQNRYYWRAESRSFLSKPPFLTGKEIEDFSFIFKYHR